MNDLKRQSQIDTPAADCVIIPTSNASIDKSASLNGRAGPQADGRSRGLDRVNAEPGANTETALSDKLRARSQMPDVAVGGGRRRQIPIERQIDHDRPLRRLHVGKTHAGLPV